MTGDPLPDGHHVSRYCRPSVVENGWPKPDAFRLRPGEDHLSLHWLEYFTATSHTVAVDQVRAGMTERGFRLGRNRRFVVLHIGQAKAAVRKEAGLELRFEHLPTDDDPAHAGMFGSQVSDLAVATELAFSITDDDIHPGRL